VIPAPVFAHSVQMLGAWFLVTPAGAIACPTRATAERVRQLLVVHDIDAAAVSCPDSLEDMPWS
jgi:hypothetical protein